MMYLINTGLGFFIAQIVAILKRNKTSGRTPEKLDPLFYLKDTWRKILLSLVLSTLLSITLHYNWNGFIELFDKQWKINELIYLAIGAAPEGLLILLWNKFDFLKPKTINFDSK